MSSTQATLLPVPSPQELLRLEDEAGVEFVDGKIVEKPVSILSCLIQQNIARLLGNEAIKLRSAEVIGTEMGYRCFSDDANRFRKPDASVVSRQRLAGIDLSEGFMRVPPDLAVEVVSSHDRASELADKVEEYLTNGFPLVWVVQPSTKTVTIHRADGTVTLLHAKDEITGESAFPTFRCKVADFFPDPIV